MFAKYWQSGTVKTRLASTIGSEATERIYRLFVETLIRRFHGVGDCRVLAYWPPERRTEFEKLAGSDWRLETQVVGDLGKRMQHYFAKSFASGAHRTVLIGSDSPTLPDRLLNEAFERLLNYPVVLGPSMDGGYYLVGAAGRVPPIFDGVEWSTRSVWKQTVSHLQTFGWRYAVLPQWYDVDQHDDLVRLHHDLVNLEEGPQRNCCEALLQTVESVLSTENS